MLKWGIVGAASIADGRLVPAMQAVGHNVVVVGSRSLERAQAFADRHGIARASGSYEDVVSSPDVDAVYVPLANHGHEPWSVAALEAGKHVLCEKPLSLDADAAARMAAAAQASQRVLLEAIMTRFHPRTAALLELLADGSVGTLRLVQASFTATIGGTDDFRMRPEFGGGALLDVGVYGVSLCRWVVGEEPDVVHAVARRPTGGIDMTTAALLRFPSGAAASVHASFESARGQTVTITGSDATLTLPHAFTANVETDAVLLRDDQPVGTWRANPYERMLTAFASAAAGEEPLPLATSDAVGNARVLDRIADASVTMPVRPPTRPT